VRTLNGSRNETSQSRRKDIAKVIRVRTGVQEIGMVEDVVSLKPQFPAYAFCNLHLLGNTEIEVDEGRSEKLILADVSNRIECRHLQCVKVSYPYLGAGRSVIWTLSVKIADLIHIADASRAQRIDTAKHRERVAGLQAGQAGNLQAFQDSSDRTVTCPRSSSTDGQFPDVVDGRDVPDVIVRVPAVKREMQ